MTVLKKEVVTVQNGADVLLAKSLEMTGMIKQLEDGKLQAEKHRPVFLHVHILV